MRVSPLALLEPNHASESCGTYKDCSAAPSAKMAGNWPSRPEKPAPMACSACSPAPSGMRIWCGTTCAAMFSSNSARTRPSWQLTRPAFPNAAASRRASRCNTVGRPESRENCQVGVFLSYVTAKGHSLIDRELYLPFDWTADPKRCQEAGIPESTRFQTKPELAVQMLERLRQAHIPISWVVADTVYGGNLDLRTWCEQHGYAYVLAVACDEPVGILTAEGERRQVEVRDVEALLLAEQDWQRLAMSEGTKGPRLFDWACVPILHRWEEDGRHWVLIRRSLSDPAEKAYYFVFAPKATTLHEMVKAIGARWHIEEDFENTKDMGLDQYEVRSWTAWYRHVTGVLLAYAFLVGICAQVRIPPCESAPQVSRPLLPPTVAEVRHLLGYLIWPPPSNAKLLLAWSWWRRCHRSGASYFHTKRRLKAG